MTAPRTQRPPKEVPLGRRVARSTRRAFYRFVHAVVPAAIRVPIRNVLRRGRPDPEERAAMRAAERESAVRQRREAKAAHAERKAQKQAEREHKEHTRAAGRAAETEAREHEVPGS